MRSGKTGWIARRRKASGGGKSSTLWEEAGSSPVMANVLRRGRKTFLFAVIGVAIFALGVSGEIGSAAPYETSGARKDTAVQPTTSSVTSLRIAAVRPGKSSRAKPSVVKRHAYSETVKKVGLAVRADGILLLNGVPWRGIGVNYFSAFLRTLLNPADISYERGFRELAEHRIPFARFMGCGYWPTEMKLYIEDPAEYFRRFDRVVRSAEKHGIGLIPSLFWHVATVPDLVGEPVGEWGNPKSRTHAFMRRYVRQVVTRYRTSPAIWGWEFGNEMNLGADLPNASEHRPPIVPDLGTPASRSERDEWSYESIRVAFREFGREVRRHDPHRVLSTGDAFPRPSAWHNWKEKSWTADSPDQQAEMLRLDNPNPIDILSVHAYEEDGKRIPDAVRSARRLRKPLFIGEFGVPEPTGGEERTGSAVTSGPEEAPNRKSEAEFVKMLDLIERSGASFAALWVFDHGDGDPFSVTATNTRSYQLRALRDANDRLRKQSHTR